MGAIGAVGGFFGRIGRCCRDQGVLLGGSSIYVGGRRRGHGVRGLISLFGIESPGLTASLALAAAVVSHAEAQQAIPASEPLWS